MPSKFKRAILSLFIPAIILVIAACPGFVLDNIIVTFGPGGEIVGAEITFTAMAPVPDSEIISYHWDFGNGYSGTGKTIVNRFGTTGRVTVKVNIVLQNNTVLIFTTNLNLGPASPSFVYFGGDNDRIFRCPTTGSFPCTPTNVATSFADDHEGIAFDYVQGFIYWADDTNVGTFTASINRCSVLGSFPCVPEHFVLVDANLEGIDISGGYLYWPESSNDRVVRCSIVAGIPCVPESVLEESSVIPDDIAFDEIRGFMYFTPNGEDEVRRCRISGPLPCTSELVISAGVDNPEGIAVDSINGFVYWGEDSDDEINRCSITSSFPCASELVLSAGVDDPMGIELDLARGILYFADIDDDDVRRCPLTAGFPCTDEEVYDVGANVEDVTLGY
jgi:hypothetical protein